MAAILTILILLASIWLTQAFIFTPLALLPGLQFPSKLALVFLVLFLCWCMGETD
ncbi:MAG: hypothetical protein WBA77_10945 [Microcoleaceae cyanobacterium]